MPSKTNADFKPSVGEVNGARFGKYAEFLGYRTIKQQIEMFNPQAGSLGDEFYDTVAEDPEDDPSLDIRDMDLAEVGHIMVSTQEKLTASAKQARQIQETVENAGKEQSVDGSSEKPPKSEA